MPNIQPIAAASEASVRLGQTPRRPSVPSGLLLGGIVLLGLAVRLYRLGGESVWYDESVSFNNLGSPDLIGFLRQVRLEDPPMMPLYFTLQYLWAHFGGAGVWTVRLLSVALGAGSILLSYSVGRRVFDRRAGLVAAALTATSLSHAYVSQEIRVYALVIFLGALSLYSLLLVQEKGGWEAWLLHIAANACLLMTHLFTPLLIFAEGLQWILCQRRPVRPLLIWTASHLVLGAAMASWAARIRFDALDSAASWIPAPGLAKLYSWFAAMAGARLTEFVAAPPKANMWAEYLGVVLVCAALLYSVAALGARRETGEPTASLRAGVTLLLLAALLPAATLCALSYVLRPCFLTRYVLFSAIPISVLSGGAFTMLRNRKLAWAMLGVVLAARAIHFAAYERPWRTDWMSLTREVRGHAAEIDRIYAFRWWQAKGLEANLADGAPAVDISASHQELAAKVSERVDGGQSAWAVVVNRADPFQAMMRSRGYGVQIQRFGGHPPAWLFRIQPPAAVLSGEQISAGGGP